MKVPNNKATNMKLAGIILACVWFPKVSLLVSLCVGSSRMSWLSQFVPST